MQIHFAPLQGYTGFEYRHTHAAMAGGVDAYYTPFIRWEKGAVRDKDVRDMLPENNGGLHLIPQVLCSDVGEFCRLADVVQEHGYGEMDLNMGCPAPMQTRRRCGSGILPHPGLVQALFGEMEKRPEVRFSAKMRLGLDRPDEWEALADIINGAPLQHLCIHPRIGRQMYKGEVDRDTFRLMTEKIHLPIIYNGDITSMADIAALERDFHGLHGVMIGRGLLARPTLAAEYRRRRDGAAGTQGRPVEDARGHAGVLHPQVQGGVANPASHPCLREYQESQLERKTWKRIMKAGNMKNYLEAIRQL